jgi:hypothetical protein
LESELAVPHETSRWARRTAVLTVLSAAAGAAAAGPAAAVTYFNTSTTINERGVATGFVQAFADDQADAVKLDVTRDGALVASAQDQWSVSFRMVPRAGDVLTLTDITKGTSATTTVTGKPSFDAGFCGPTTTFAGTRDPDGALDVGAVAPHGPYDPLVLSSGATISSLSGPAFSGTFQRLVGADWTASIIQTLQPSPEVIVYSSSSRKVGACPTVPATTFPSRARPARPVVPVVPVRVVDLLKPFAKLATPAALFRASTAYRALMRGTFKTTVLVSERGTVRQTLYLDDGAKLPVATPAAKKRKAQAKKLTVIGAGNAVVKHAGAVKVTVKLSKKGKARLQRSRTVKLALVTSVRDLAGNTFVMAPTRFAVTHAKGKR